MELNNNRSLLAKAGRFFYNDIKEFLKRENFLFIAGNHEYAKYNGKNEDMAYRLNSMKKIGGYPIILFIHAPLYENKLYKKSYKI